MTATTSPACRPSPLVPSIVAPEINRQKTFTQELNLISSAEPLWGRLDWVAGLFYLDTQVDILFHEYLDFGFDGRFDPISVEEVRSYALGDYGFISNSKPERDSLSVYAEGTYSLGYSARLIAGLRYTNDEVHSEVTNFFGRAPAPRCCRPEAAKSRAASSWSRTLGEDAMVYGSYTRGFKPGGSNLTFGRESVIAPIVVQQTFDRETVQAWEAGVKAHFANDRFRVNAAVFLYDYGKPAIPSH